VSELPEERTHREGRAKKSTETTDQVAISPQPAEHVDTLQSINTVQERERASRHDAKTCTE